MNEKMTADIARSIRDNLLKQSDYLVLPDSSKDTPEVRAYRQALRDVTQQDGFPENIVWPTLN
jgi:hypothetical protein